MKTMMPKIGLLEMRINRSSSEQQSSAVEVARLQNENSDLVKKVTEKDIEIYKLKGQSDSMKERGVQANKKIYQMRNLLTYYKNKCGELRDAEKEVVTNVHTFYFIFVKGARI